VSKPLAAVTLADLSAFDQSLASLASATRYRILSAIKSLLSFGHQIGYLRFDVGRVLRLPLVRSRLAQRILPEADVHRMLSLEPEKRNHALLILLYASGIRVHELCNLTWADLQAHEQGGQITLSGKGGKTRSVLLPVSVWHQVNRLRGHSLQTAPVFVSRKRRNQQPGRLSEAQVWRIVRAAARRAGIEGNVSPHWMRHAHGSHALDRGAPIHLVQATLGHASVATTGKYLHARPKDSSSRFLAL
jgi:integrase/recombinase XerD